MMKYKYKIKLDTMNDVNQFVEKVSNIGVPVKLTDGKNYQINAKSILGVMYSFEWSEVFAESDTEIYGQIIDYVI